MILKHKCRNSWDIKSISFETFDRKKACSDDYIWLCTVCWFQNQVRIHHLWTYVIIKLFVAVVDNRLRSESIPRVDFWVKSFAYEFQIASPEIGMQILILFSVENFTLCEIKHNSSLFLWQIFRSGRKKGSDWIIFLGWNLHQSLHMTIKGIFQQ